MNTTLEASIKSHPFFHGLKPHHLATLAKGATEAVFNPGEKLFLEGEPANRFFLVQSGSVALEVHEPSDGTALVQCVHGGDVIGWSWLFPPFVWHLRARAVEITRVIILDGAHLLAEAEQNHDFGFELMKRVTQILIHRLQAARRRLLDAETETALSG